MALDDVRSALWAVEEALLEGDNKYGKNAWRDRPKLDDPAMRVDDHIAGAQRHINRHRRGEVVDADSGKLALAHAVARGLLALQTHINHNGGSMSRIELGDTARDTITGFEGVVVCDAKWLHGCRRLTIQPRQLHEGKPVDMQTFDEPQLLLVRGVRPEASTVDGGGPRPEPQRR